jgi:hypothetical protein
VVRIDDAGVAAIVVAVNTVVGFAVRVLVAPVAAAMVPPASSPAPSAAHEGLAA